LFTKTFYLLEQSSATRFFIFLMADQGCVYVLILFFGQANIHFDEFPFIGLLVLYETP